MQLKTFFKKVWWRMPIDGAGIVRFGPQAERRLTRVLTQHRWKIFPAWSRPIGWSIVRLLWLVNCPMQIFKVVRRSAAPVSWRVKLYALWLGWTRGKAPRLFIAAYSSIGTGNLAKRQRRMLIDSLDDMQGGILLHALGHKKDILRAADKLEFTRALIELEISVAPILMELSAKNVDTDFFALPWTHHKKLLLKPRRGSGGKHVMVLEKSIGNLFRVNNILIGQKSFLNHLKSITSKDSILVQPYLRPSPSTYDISRVRAPQLRIHVYRSPGGQAKHLSSSLNIHPGDAAPETNVSKILMAPINPETSTVCKGVLIYTSDSRYSHLPWNNAQLEGRFIPEFEQSLQMVLQGSNLLPDVPLIGWDILLTDNGPIILEPNIGIPLSMAQLWHYETGAKSPLVQTLLEWI